MTVLREILLSFAAARIIMVGIMTALSIGKVPIDSTYAMRSLRVGTEDLRGRTRISASVYNETFSDEVNVSLFMSVRDTDGNELLVDSVFIPRLRGRESKYCVWRVDTKHRGSSIIDEDSIIIASSLLDLRYKEKGEPLLEERVKEKERKELEARKKKEEEKKQKAQEKEEEDDITWIDFPSGKRRARVK
jgi:hypothetical protein